MNRPIAWMLCWSVGVCSGAGAAQDGATDTASQVQQGAAIYGRQCAVCHGDTLQGGAGPALKGIAFDALAAKEHLTASSLLDVITRTMPITAPGSLKQEEYAAVASYLVQQSGLPAIDAVAGPAAALRTASQGVYTDAQRAQGQALYSDNCIQCHGGELDGVEDAPPLAGKLFISKWGALPVGSLHAFIDASMPPGNGGALGAVPEAAVVAYILFKNHFPAGSTPLPADPAGLNSIVLK